MIDAYAHPVPPAFTTVEEYLHVLDEHGFSNGVAAASAGCPNLVYLAELVASHRDRLRVVGLPVGESDEEIRNACESQMAAGMCGIRLFSKTVERVPRVLESIGRRGGYIWPFGDLPGMARRLLSWLDRYPEAGVMAQHFASIPPPERQTDAMLDLLRHERFFVIASRQGGYPADDLRASVAAMMEHVSADRWLWGSEYPVTLGRGETFAGSMTWMADRGYLQTEQEQRAFFHENAQRLLFDRQWSVEQPLDPALCHYDHTHPATELL